MIQCRSSLPRGILRVRPFKCRSFATINPCTTMRFGLAMASKQSNYYPDYTYDGLLEVALAPARSFPQTNTVVTRLYDAKHDREFFLVGTLHITDVSARLVSEVVELVSPDTVVVELDDARAESLPKFADKSEKPRNFPSFSESLARSVTSGEGLVAGSLKFVLGRTYQRLHMAGVSVGNEFITAMRLAEEKHLDLICGDRPVSVTIGRLVPALFDAVIRSFFAFAPSFFSRRKPPVEVPKQFRDIGVAVDRLRVGEGNVSEVESKVKAALDRQLARGVVDKLKEIAPLLSQVMLSERDVVLAVSMLENTGKRVVLVCGLAHVDGIERLFYHCTRTTPPAADSAHDS